jgi:uncharacterized protein involved in outer membrane biogenesis
LSRRRLIVWVSGLLGAVASLGVGSILLLVSVDLRHLLEVYGSASLGRRMTIGSLRIGWGNPLSVELRDFRLANAPWGSSPEMLQMDSLSAEIDVWSLFGGALRFEKLEVVNPVIVVERKGDSAANWHFGKNGSPSLAPSLVRSRFPTLNVFSLRGGKVNVRSSSGNWLRIELRDLKIHSAGADQPVAVALDGTFNGLAAELMGEGQSFNIMRDVSVPYGMTFSIANAETAIDFKGTVMDPANFDGVHGLIKIKAQKLDDLLRAFNGATGYNPSLQLGGNLIRSGTHWRISDASGSLVGNAFTGALSLDEGGRGQTDSLGTDLAFARLDLNPLFASANKAGGAKTDDWSTLSLRSDEKRGTNISTHVAAKILTYGAMRLVDVGFRGRLISGATILEQLKFAYAGGTLDMSGSVENVVGGGHIVAHATVSRVDVDRLSQMAGAKAGQISGKLDGGATLDLTGGTARAALEASRGHSVLAVTQGHIARDLIEQISTDLRSLFRTSQGTAEVNCLLGMVDVRNGIGVVWPLRLRTPDGTLVGGGSVDFLRQRLDLTIQSESASTSFFALDVPISISGDFQHPTIRPQIGSSGASLKSMAEDPLQDLPQDLREMGQRNSCLR